MPLNFLLEEDFQPRLGLSEMVPMLTALAAIGLSPWLVGLMPADPLQLSWLLEGAPALARLQLDWTAAVYDGQIGPGGPPIAPEAAPPLLVWPGQAIAARVTAPFQIIGLVLCLSLGLNAYAAARMARALGAGPAISFIFGLVAVLVPAAAVMPGDPMLGQVWPILLAAALAVESRRKAVTVSRALTRLGLVAVAAALHAFILVLTLGLLALPLVRLMLRRDARAGQRQRAVLLLAGLAAVPAALWALIGAIPGWLDPGLAARRVATVPMRATDAWGSVITVLPLIAGALLACIPGSHRHPHHRHPHTMPAILPLWPLPALAGLWGLAVILGADLLVTEQRLSGFGGQLLTWLLLVTLVAPVLAITGAHLRRLRPGLGLLASLLALAIALLAHPPSPYGGLEIRSEAPGVGVLYQARTVSQIAQADSLAAAWPPFDGVQAEPVLAYWALRLGKRLIGADQPAGPRPLRLTRQPTGTDDCLSLAPLPQWLCR